MSGSGGRLDGVTLAIDERAKLAKLRDNIDWVVNVVQGHLDNGIPTGLEVDLKGEFQDLTARLTSSLRTSSELHIWCAVTFEEIVAMVFAHPTHRETWVSTLGMLRSMQHALKERAEKPS